MKAMLYTAVEEAPSAENVEPEVLSRHFANFDETFFHYCDQELKKITTFYSGNFLLFIFSINKKHVFNFSCIHIHFVNCFKESSIKYIAQIYIVLDPPFSC